jgi:hypothetical protein
MVLDLNVLCPDMEHLIFFFLGSRAPITPKQDYILKLLLPEATWEYSSAKVDQKTHTTPPSHIYPVLSLPPYGHNKL